MTSRPPEGEHDDTQALSTGTPSGHEQWDELAVGYALTALEPDELERFVEHLVAFCPECQRSVDDTAGVGAFLGGSMPGPIAAPRQELRSSVLRAALAARPAVPQTSADVPEMPELDSAPARLGLAPSIAAEPVAAEAVAAEADAAEPGAADTGAAAPEAGGQPNGTRRERVGSGAHRVVDLSERRALRASRSAGWLVAAAAAVVAAVLSVTTIAALHSRSTAQASSRSYQRDITAAVGTSGQVVALKNDNGAGVASVIARPDQVSVVSLDLTPNPKTSTYVLWGINGKTAGPIALGVFDVTGNHVQTTQVATDARGYASFKSYAVSREPGRTPPKSPTTIVATGTT